MTTCTLPRYQWKELTVDGKRCIQEENSGLVYRNDDSNSLIIQKLVALGIATIPIILPIRMITRLILLATGTWISSGYGKTQKTWNKLCFDWYKNEPHNPPPPSFQYYAILVQNIGTEFIDQIVKCATLPLAAIALTFVAFAGILSPLDGRKLYSDIEWYWSITLPESMTDQLTMRYCNYIALCMQPISHWKEQNLFRFFPHANPSLSLIYTLQQFEKDGFIVLGNDLNTWKEAVKAGIDDNGELQKLVNACNDLNTLIVSHANQATINECEQRKQQAIKQLKLEFKLPLKPSISEPENPGTD